MRETARRFLLSTYTTQTHFLVCKAVRLGLRVRTVFMYRFFFLKNKHENKGTIGSFLDFPGSAKSPNLQITEYPQRVVPGKKAEHLQGFLVRLRTRTRGYVQPYHATYQLRTCRVWESRMGPAAKLFSSWTRESDRDITCFYFKRGSGRIV